MLKPISLILVSMIGIAVVVVAVQNPPEDDSVQYRFSGIITKITDGDTLDFRIMNCLLYTSPSPRDATLSRMPSSA